ncbi:UNVERIFIED_CONTAM: hypothetical protein ABID98_002392 [Brevibacillus sp. OAP136]
MPFLYSPKHFRYAYTGDQLAEGVVPRAVGTKSQRLQEMPPAVLKRMEDMVNIEIKRGAM